MADKKTGVEEISRRTGVSIATVSKALNNCGGVDARTKEAVLKAAAELEYAPPQKARVGRRQGWRIGIAMPINPYYFWNEAIRGMKEAAEERGGPLPVFSLFANMASEKDALYCLDYLTDLPVDLLVVTPPAYPSVEEKLRGIARSIPLVFFNETASVSALFYAGANFYQDGMRLARACGEDIRRHPGILAVGCGEMAMVRRRDEGFRQELASLVPEAVWVGEVEVDGMAVPALSARLARDIWNTYGQGFRSVYVSSGILPQVCLALQKLKRLDDVAVFGYENPAGNDAYIRGGAITAVMEQDMAGQGRRCLEAVYAYLEEGRLPDNRRLYVPSHLHRREEMR